MKEKRYSISEASRLLEVENHVLRYWEEELGLTIPRNELGHRYYREEEIQLLNCIKELKNKGFQLKAVKEVLPDLEQKKLIDVHKLLATQVELENMGIEEEDRSQEKDKSGEEDRSRNDNSEDAYADHGIHTEDGRDTELRQAGGGDGKEITVRENGQGGKVVTLRKGGGHVERHPASRENTSPSFRSNEEKMREFESIMGRIIGKALREQAEHMGDVMGDRISNRVIREIDDVMEEREEREEARYKKLDEAIRSHQKARQEIAVSKEEGGRKKSRFFRKNKRKI